MTNEAQEGETAEISAFVAEATSAIEHLCSGRYSAALRKRLPVGDIPSRAEPANVDVRKSSRPISSVSAFSMPSVQVGLSEKTVVAVDLIGYSSIVRSLEPGASPQAFADLEKEILSFVRRAAALQAAQEYDLITTGDGAILVFAVAEGAHRFGKSLQEAGSAHSVAAPVASSQRWFRVGIATGALSDLESAGRRSYSGITIATAVRLEAVGRAGELVLDMRTWAALPPALRALYGPEEKVRGKRDEEFLVRRYQVVLQAPEIVSTEPSRSSSWNKRSEVLHLIEKLEFDGEMEKLMFLIEMPISERPKGVSPNVKRAQILNWVDAHSGSGIDHLLDNLELLLKIQTSQIKHH